MAGGLSVTKERVPLSVLEKFPNSGRVRMSYCEVATTSTQPQPPPPAIVKTATKQPKAIGRSNSFTFDFVRPQVFTSVCRSRNSLDERHNETEQSYLSSKITTLFESGDR